MTPDRLISRIRTRQFCHLRAGFPMLSERDLLLMLGSTPQQAVYILQQCCGYEVEEARAAWNDFVLRYLDGPAPHSQPYAAAQEAG